MTRPPLVNFRTMDKLLIQFGRARQKGGHVFYRHPDGRTTTVPNHPGRDLARPLVREILREIEVTRDQFEQILRKQ